jgi:outer membrane murein-binding lipoprotein Lpp
VNTQTRSDPSRSQRDELEQLQQELREARRQRDELPREHAELTTRVARLEQEVQSLRQSVAEAREEAERPAASLPEQLVLPFRAAPSRRTAYGRTRYALMLLAPVLSTFFYFPATLFDSRMGPLLVGGLFLLCLSLAFVLQGPEDDEEGPAWSFTEEGLAPVGAGTPHGIVRYAEIQKVEVKQGWLQRLYGFGSVRILWTPAAPTSIGKSVNYPNRSVDIDMLDEPRRLGEWLQAQVRKAKEAPRGV